MREMLTKEYLELPDAGEICEINIRIAAVMANKRKYTEAKKELCKEFSYSSRYKEGDTKGFLIIGEMDDCGNVTLKQEDVHLI